MSGGSMMETKQRTIDSLLPLSQAVFYIATGIWSIVDDRSFQKVTGPKFDVWLVKTVGVLVTVIGAVLLLGSRRDDDRPETTVLAAGSALGLAAIDVIYVSKRRIRSVYLLDAVAELLLVGGWIWR